MDKIATILYRDIARNEFLERETLRTRLDQLKKIEKSSRTLNPDERVEMARIKSVLEALKHSEWSELCNRLFVGVRDMFNQSPGLLGGKLENHNANGKLGLSHVSGLSHDLQSGLCKASLTIGLLMIDGAAGIAPVVHAIRPLHEDTSNVSLVEAVVEAISESTESTASAPRLIYSDDKSSAWANLNRMFFAAIGEAQSMLELAKLVLPLLAIEGDPRGKADDTAGTVDAEEFGWKVLLPVATINLIVTAAGVLYFGL